MRTFCSILVSLYCVFMFSVAIPLKAIAYSQKDLKECILTAKSNPIILGAPQDSIEDFCSCTLKLVVDKGQYYQGSQSSISS